MDKRLELKRKLEICVEDLSSCLVEQPSLFSDVADLYAAASADRDQAKLVLEELTADLDRQLRATAVKNEEKVTEASLQRHITTLPTIQKAQQTFLDKRADADEWGALKEAYQQRSFMLRELVALHLAQLNNLSLERGAHGASRDLAEGTKAVVERARRRGEI